MCVTPHGRIPASHYLAAAKKRTRELKKLKSVSRAYRKSQVRELKHAAFMAKAMEDDEHWRVESQRMQREALQNAYQYGQYGQYNATQNVEGSLWRSIIGWK